MGADPHGNHTGVPPDWHRPNAVICMGLGGRQCIAVRSHSLTLARYRPTRRWKNKGSPLLLPRIQYMFAAGRGRQGIVLWGVLQEFPAGNAPEVAYFHRVSKQHGKFAL